MNGQMIFANLRARPVRTLVSVLAVALEVIMILMIVGLTKGILNDTGKRVEGVGADIMLQPPGTSFILGLSGSALRPVGKLLDRVSKIDGVKAVTPILLDVNIQDGVEMIDGIDPASFGAVSGGFTYLKGKLFSSPNEVIVDDVFAKANQVTAGDTIGLLNQTYKISGIVEHGKGARVYMSLQELQNLMGAIDHASYFFIKVNDPSHVNDVIARIKNDMPGYEVNNAQIFSQFMTAANIPGLNEFISTVVFVAICVGVLVIFLSMYTTITERTREIGILRSLGASKSFIMVLIMQETIVICLMGIVVGVVGSTVIARVAVAVHPTLAVMLTNSWRGYASLFAILSGIVGAIYPSFKAAAKDPIESLAYE